MAELSLSDELAATLGAVDELARRHRAAEAYDTALARTDFLYDLLDRLAGELQGLRRAAEDLGGEETWRSTCRELGTAAPETLRSPAQALTLGDLELLRLVAYTGAAIALARERRVALESERGNGLA